MTVMGIKFGLAPDIAAMGFPHNYAVFIYHITVPSPGSKLHTWPFLKKVVHATTGHFVKLSPASCLMVSGCRFLSDCRSRGPEFDPGQVPYFCGD